MDIHQLRIFASVYHFRSFSKASGHLHISQPTISEHIKNLEEELECSLFDRLGRSIMPTREAKRIYPKAVKLIEDLEAIKETIRTGLTDIKGSLKIGASTIPGNYMLPFLAAKFKKKHPDISFEIIIADTRKTTDSILQHEILLGIVGASMEPRSLSYEAVFCDELVFAGTPDLLDSNAGTWDIYSLPFLIREEGSGTRKTMEDWLEKMEINARKLNVVAILGSTDAVKQALKAGLGTSIISRRAIEEELDNGSLIQKKIGPEMKRSFYLAHHKKRSLPAHYQAFCDFLKQTENE
ncbi:MAG: LysR family transcriptional regulator [Desulfobulbaceae bacterium]|uniref:LysR family transcriptional regulator n=1 Tax=Candidatus Desulfobia pelagia TaxID=2841692 RepID=A0A8J6NGE8_9BACT|nr:LysR family transcriptional regulator [Candidatus Desulfobia pelagia]